MYTSSIKINARSVGDKKKLWKVWTQESFQKVEFDRPGERSPE